MSDYSTEFSLMIPIPDDKLGLADAWIRRELEEQERVISSGDACDEKWDVYAGILFELQGHNIWLHDDCGEGSVEAAEYFIARLLTDLDMPDAIFLSWCSYCSSPIQLSQNGGGEVITRNGVQHCVNSYDAVREAGDNNLVVTNLGV